MITDGEVAGGTGRWRGEGNAVFSNCSEQGLGHQKTDKEALRKRGKLLVVGVPKNGDGR